ECPPGNGGPGPGILESREGLREDGRGAFEGGGLLLRRRPAVHDRLDPPRPSPEQVPERRGHPLSPDARFPRAGPARVRHAWPPDRGPGREDRSEERRVGKECRARKAAAQEKVKEKKE